MSTADFEAATYKVEPVGGPGVERASQIADVKHGAFFGRRLLQGFGIHLMRKAAACIHPSNTIYIRPGTNPCLNDAYCAT